MSKAQKRSKTRRRITYSRNSQNRLSMVLAVTVMVIILVAVTVRGFSLHSKLEEYNETMEDLQAQIDSELERQTEIEEYAKYTQTDEYVEEVAREKLGLVKEGEIIFKNEENSSYSYEGSSSQEESTQEEDEDAAEEEDVLSEETQVAE